MGKAVKLRVVAVIVWIEAAGDLAVAGTKWPSAMEIRATRRRKESQRRRERRAAGKAAVEASVLSMSKQSWPRPDEAVRVAEF